MKRMLYLLAALVAGIFVASFCTGCCCEARSPFVFSRTPYKTAPAVPANTTYQTPYYPRQQPPQLQPTQQPNLVPVKPQIERLPPVKQQGWHAVEKDRTV